MITNYKITGGGLCKTRHDAVIIGKQDCNGERIKVAVRFQRYTRSGFLIETEYWVRNVDVLHGWLFCDCDKSYKTAGRFCTKYNIGLDTFGNENTNAYEVRMFHDGCESYRSYWLSSKPTEDEIKVLICDAKRDLFDRMVVINKRTGETEDIYKIDY